MNVRQLMEWLGRFDGDEEAWVDVSVPEAGWTTPTDDVALGTDGSGEPHIAVDLLLSSLTWPGVWDRLVGRVGELDRLCREDGYRAPREEG